MVKAKGLGPPPGDFREKKKWRSGRWTRVAALGVQQPCLAVEPDQGSHPSDTASSKCGVRLGGSQHVCVCVCETEREREGERT